MKLYLVRHGETTANEEGVYYGRLDVSLNSNGIEQCQQLAPVFRHLCFDQVIVSSLQRTHQSAKLMLGNKSDNMLIFPEFDELDFGEWEGRHYQDLIKEDNEHYAAWCNDWVNIAPPKGESFIQFMARIDHGLKQLLNAGYKQVVIVSHQGVLRTILLLMLNMPPHAFWHFSFEHGAYSLLEFVESHAVIKKINAMQ